MKRTITTDFQNDRGEIILTTRSCNPNTASLNAYGALLMGLTRNGELAMKVEVYHSETGVVYSQFLRRKNGQIIPHYEYDPKDYASPIRIKLDVLLKD